MYETGIIVILSLIVLLVLATFGLIIYTKIKYPENQEEINEQ